MLPPPRPIYIMIRRSFDSFHSPLDHPKLFGFLAAALIWSPVAANSQAACPVAEGTRPYIKEIVSKLIFDTAFVTGNVHAQDRGFALSLFGVDQGLLGQLLLAQECTTPEAFKPTFERFAGGTTSRSQVVCEARGIDVIKLAVASTNTEMLSAFRSLSYDATRYSGKVLYRPYVSIDWRTIALADGNFSVSAGLFRRLIFHPTVGAPVDLTHFGSLSGRVINNEPTSAAVFAIFPAVIASGQPLIVRVDVDEHGVASGRIRTADKRLARVSGTAFEPIIEWQGECALGTP